MSLVVPQVGAIVLAEQQRSRWNASPTRLSLHLYINDITPNAGSTLGDFVEASFIGYLPGQINPWGLPVTVDGRARSAASAVTFTKTAGSPASVYGYFVTDENGALLWAERDPAAPVPMMADGQTYTVVPRFTWVSEF